MTVQSKKAKEVAKKKKGKKGIEKLQEEHQQSITYCDNQIQALEFTNEKNPQKKMMQQLHCLIMT